MVEWDGFMGTGGGHILDWCHARCLKAQDTQPLEHVGLHVAQVDRAPSWRETDHPVKVDRDASFTDWHAPDKSTDCTAFIEVRLMTMA
jgi:hypothetical protein